MDRRHGRSFNESDDDEFIQERNSMQVLLNKFDNVEHVLENAALTAALMHYIFNKSQDYLSLLYYYTIQKYLRVNETKNSMRNYNHINMEIYAVFIHPKSILQIPSKGRDIMEKIEESMDSEDCIVHFNKLSKSIVSDVLTKYVEQFKNSIKLGLESFSYSNNIHEDLNRASELNILNSLHKVIMNSFVRNQKSRCLPFQKQDVKNSQLLYDFQIKALEKSLQTQYEYFLFAKKYSYIIKNPNIVIPKKTFLSSSPQKVPCKQRIKGHCFEEDSMPKVTFCLVCELILWGSHPNCLYCRNCKKAIHKECKEGVKYCQIDTKRLKKNDSIDSDAAKEKDRTLEGEIRTDYENVAPRLLSTVSETVLGQKMTRDLTNFIDGKKVGCDSSKSPSETPIYAKECSPTLENGYSDEARSAKNKEKPKLPTKPSESILQEFKSKYSASFTSDKNKKSNMKYALSMNINQDDRKASLDVVTRSKSARSPSPKLLFKQERNRFHLRSASEDSGLLSTFAIAKLSLNPSDVDDEMKVLETFEAEVELRLFSKPCCKMGLHAEAQYKRLLVLLEFHHKTRFIRMTLKRFKYLLVDPWVRMGEYLELFDTLSLGCIDKLYKLIGSLVSVIDSCKCDDTYDSTISDKVLQWLSEDEDKNLQCWLQLSIDLCCTNILQAVKNNWMEYKQLYPKLTELFSTEVNRILIIEQLSSMKPLLFNLPMIVTKIVKDLSHFSQFREEAKTWEQVGLKLSYLPHLIDERCMPVVPLINNGIICPSSLKYKRYNHKKENDKEMEAYIKNFPKTIFKNNFIDFQFVRISKLRESYSRDVKSLQPAEFIREEVDAAVICYENEMILLQKENEKYFLKQFKSPGAHKLFPMIPFYQVHATKQTIKENKQFQHELSVLLINQALLVQILFKDYKSRDKWYDHITRRAKKIQKESSSQDQSSTASSSAMSPSTFDFVDGDNVLNLTETEDTNNKVTSSIRNRLNDSVNNFLSTFDFITSTLSSPESPGGILKRIKQDGPNSPSEFMFRYVDILKEYALLGSEIMEESHTVGSSEILKEEVLSSKISKLKDITEQMSSLIRSQQKAEVECKSSDESTIEDPSLEMLDIEQQSLDIHNYIEDIIAEAINKLNQSPRP